MITGAPVRAFDQSADIAPHSSARYEHRRWSIDVGAIFMAIGILMSPITTLRPIGSMLYADLFILAAAGMFVFASAREDRPLWLPWWFWIASLLMLLPEMLQYFPDGTGPRNSLAPVANIYLCWILTPVVIANMANTPELLRKMVFVWAIAGVLAAVLAYAARMGVHLPGLSAGVGGQRIRGYALHPNEMGILCATPVGVLLGWAMRKGVSVLSALALAAIAFQFYIINLTGSRTALIAGLIYLFIVSVSWLLGASRQRGLLRVMVLYLGFLGAILAVYFAIDTDMSAISRMFGDARSALVSDEARAAKAALALEGFWEDPLRGQGYYRFISAHNAWLSMLQCGGIFGLGFLLIRDIGVFSVLARGFRAARRFSADSRVAYVSLAAVFVFWLLVCVKEAHGSNRYALIGIGLALAAARQLQSAVEVDSRYSE